jgi:hypothetical protein
LVKSAFRNDATRAKNGAKLLPIFELKNQMYRKNSLKKLNISRDV